MPITNEDIANALQNIADALEGQEENPYRIRAYRRAANSIKRYEDNIHELVIQNVDITIVPNVGERLSEVIKIIVTTGNLEYRLENKPAMPLPKNLFEKKIKRPSFRIYSVIPMVDRILKNLEKMSEISKIEVAGDYRRKKEVIDHVEIVIITNDVETVFAKFQTFPSIKYIITTTDTMTTVQLKLGLHVTLHIATEKNFGSQLFFATGSIEHDEAIENLAKDKKISISQSPNEKNIYKNLNLEFIPPELRENRGEIQTAAKNKLPKLLELKDIKGDLHCHTNETDGVFPLEEMVAAAQEQGYEYVAITDHSQSLKITRGLNEERLWQQIKLIDRLNAKLKNFTILKSLEVDILADGSLDLSNDILKELDLTVCSVHSKFNLPLQEQTERVIRAMDNPYFNILGHATGRLIKSRPPYKIDMDAILQAAKDRNCCIEVNAQPARLDINDLYCMQAKKMGVKVAISSDAHSTHGFTFMILGVNQARRGWLEPKDVINTYSLPKLKKIIKRK